MSGTIKQWADATAASPKRAAAKALTARITSGTTSDGHPKAFVVWMGDNLALFAWEWGGKEVVVVDDPRGARSYNSAAARALRSFHFRDLPNRLTGRELDDLIARLSIADELWPTRLAEAQREDKAAAEREAEKKQREDEAARARHMAATRQAKLAALAPKMLEVLIDLTALYASTPGADPHFIDKARTIITAAKEA